MRVIGSDLIVMVKTNTKGVCKYTINSIAKDWKIVSYLLFKIKSTVLENTPLVAIGSSITVKNFSLSFQLRGEG